MKADYVRQLIKGLEAHKKQQAADEAARKAPGSDYCARIHAPRVVDEIKKKILERIMDRDLIHRSDCQEKCAKEVVRLLRADGYIVSMGSMWVPAYEGSNDDNYAYAHAGYWAHDIAVRW